MKMIFAAAAAATALIGGAAFAQDQTAQPAAPEHGSIATTSTTVSAPDAAQTGQAINTTSTTVTAPSGASVTTSMTTNGPVQDTAANRAKYGGPMSNAGKHTAAKGN